MRAIHPFHSGASAIGLGLALLFGGARAADVPPSPEAQATSGQSAFDFLIGNWKVHNRRLSRPLSGSTTWYEFDGTSVARKVWDGRATMDEYEADSPSGHIEGMTVRLYDSKAGQWSLYWANAKDGKLEQPTVGEFKNGRDEFYDHERFDGRAIFVRYVWSEIKPTSCRWEQAFSVDGGRTWETNWIMELTRSQ